MKPIYFFLFASLLIFSACSKDRIAGSGSVSTEQRSISNFTGIHMSGSTNVLVNQGPNFSVLVKGYDNLLPYFETRVVNGVLELGFKNNSNVKNDNVQVTVTLPVLSGLSLSGSGDIDARGNFTASNSLETSISGSGNIFIGQGYANKFFASISGSGNVQAFGFNSRTAEVITSGSGNVELTATETLKVRIAGSGSVYYKGTPAIDAQISGSGSIVKR